jgi:hypothetical protein
MRVKAAVGALSVLALPAILCAGSAQGMGVGAYGSGLAGGSFWSYQNYFYNGPGLTFMSSLQLRKKSSGPIAAFGGGLMLDTNPTGTGPVNYRFNLGVDRAYVYTPNYKRLLRFNAINTLGFNVYRNQGLKVWLGPQLMISYMYGDDSVRDYEMKIASSEAASVSVTAPSWYTRRYKLGGVSIGAATGVNYRVSGSFYLSIETGIRGCMYLYAGRMRGAHVLVKEFYYYGGPNASYSGYEGYLSCGVMYGTQ